MQSQSSFAAIVLLLSASIAGATVVDPSERIGPTPDEIKNVGQSEKLNAQIPLDLAFVDSRGNPATLAASFDGTRPVILTLNYSNCPRLCSLQLNGLFEGLQKLDYDLGDKYRMITVSIDPLETPEKAESTKQKYLEAYGRTGASDGWDCLVGREENIRALADSVGFTYAVIPDTEPKQYAHAAVTILCTPDGRVSRYLYGIEYDPTTLRMSLLEAGEGKIGTTTEQLLLFCFSYDPNAGSYTLAAVRVMQAGGVLTLLILGGVLFVFWRREVGKTRRSEPSTQSDPS